jgi:hypothetical protein
MIAFQARAHVEEMFIPDKKYSTLDVGYLSYAKNVQKCTAHESFLLTPTVTNIDISLST